MRALLTLSLAICLALVLAACCPPAVTSSESLQQEPPADGYVASGGYGLALLGQSTDDDAGSAAAATSEAGARGERTDDDIDVVARFESAWGLVAERYWDLDSLGVDWQEVGERYRARLSDSMSEDELYTLLEEMYQELGDNHSVFVPPSRVAEIRELYGNLPCVAVFDSSAMHSPAAFGQLRAQVPDGLDTDRFGPIEYGLTHAGDVAVGYVRVADLASDGVAAGLRSAVQSLAAQGADAFIVDLRGNPGGRLVTMMQAAGVFTRGFLWRAVMSWTLPMPYPAIGEPATDKPLVVLVDGAVNSAAEGLAGALKANSRAFLVGETTAGNVEAVLPFCLRDGSQAWIATGVLAPLLGPTWEGRGVEPDLEAPSEQAFERALDHLRQSGATGSSAP